MGKPRALTATLRVGHLSLYHGADPEAVARYIAEVIERDKRQILTTTESNRAMATAVRRELGPTWGVQRQGEYLHIWERKVLQPARIRQSIRRVTHVHKGSKSWRDVWIAGKHFTHRSTLLPVLIEAAHMPAGVEMGDHWRNNPAQVAASKRGFRKWGRRVRSRLRLRPRLVQLLHMDANLDQHRAVWRRYTEATLGLPSIWRTSRPNGGTHGGRLIDTAHANVPVTNQRITSVAPPPRVDHRGFIYDAQLRRAS